jgi:hypothetical protein
MVQGFLAAYLNIMDYFICYTEPELNKGYADFLLEPVSIKYPDIRYACIVELKYIKRSEYSETILQEKIDEAKTQLNTYQQDPFILEKVDGKNLLKLILVFNGWELVHKESIP